MKKRIIALVLVVSQLFMAWSMSIGVSAASARNARSPNGKRPFQER